MSRNLLIAGGVLLGLALLLYFLVFRPAPPPDPRLAQLVDLAERVCLSDVASSKTATLQAQLHAVKGLAATASAGTAAQEKRGAVETLDGTLKAEQDDHIRACMQPFVKRMLQLTT